MAILTELWEGGADGVDITTVNSMASSVVKVGSGTQIAKFDTSVDPFPGGTTSARFRCSATGTPPKSVATLFDLSSPSVVFDFLTYVRFNTLPTYVFPNNNTIRGSLNGAAMFLMQRSSTFILQCSLGPDGHIVVLTGGTASDWRVIKSDGNLSTGHDFDGDGHVFFAPGVDYKVRITGDVSGWDIYIDDVKVNASPLPFRNPVSSGYETYRIGNLRFNDDIHFGNTSWDTAQVFGPTPGGGFAADIGG